MTKKLEGLPRRASYTPEVRRPPSGTQFTPATPATRVAVGERFLALDGIRGLALIAVLCFHFAGTWVARNPVDRVVLGVFNSGWTGVDLFFVLSGFLITGILLDTRSDAHYFRNFYARRTLRIFPLYYGVLAAVMIVAPALIPRVRTMDMLTTLRDNGVWFWTYLINVRIAATHSWDPAVPGRLMHFWSLAVEEQFYLLWPLIVLAAGRKKLLWVCGAVVLMAFGVRIALILGDHGPVAGYAYTRFVSGYVLLPARADTLAVGAALACMTRTPGGYAWMRRFATPALVASVIALIAVAAPRGSLMEYSPTVEIIGYPLLALACASLIVIALNPAPSLTRRSFEWRPLRKVGMLAYGMYVFHYPLRYALAGVAERLQHVAPNGPTMLPELIAFIALGFALTWVIAFVSWRCYEAPILRLKRYFVTERRSEA
ncbi:MAG TPA: acyltransferase [Gemmatimonadaceae bacterium]